MFEKKIIKITVSINNISDVSKILATSTLVDVTLTHISDEVLFEVLWQCKVSTTVRNNKVFLMFAGNLPSFYDECNFSVTFSKN